MNNQPEKEQTSDLFEHRLKKLHELKFAGKNPYENYFKPDHFSVDLMNRNQAEFDENETIKIAGRIRSKRLMGKAAFMEIEDATGRIQVYGNQKQLLEQFALFKNLDLGDIAGFTGFLFTTKTGQTTVHVKSIQMLAKDLRPLPVVKEADGKIFDAFSDKEQRYRMRYVDLIVNRQVREVFIKRSRIISELRNFLTQKGFLEVETPMMHPIPGGAAARPFVTHHNTLDMDLYLRIAPELYLKRLIVGGFPGVFEINRNFRNEGISIKHNPEFTMLEIYEAYGNMESMMLLFEDIMRHLVDKICDDFIVEYGEHKINLKPPYERLAYVDAIEKYSGIKIDSKMELNKLKKDSLSIGMPEKEVQDAKSIWKIAEILFDRKVEEKLIQPVFITDFPTELSPLAKSWPDRPEFTQRFEPYIVGRELGNAFSELNDPEDQKKRFEAQVEQRQSGDEEGGYMDLDYIRALEYGMPPTGGLGIGIDRLVMLLTNSASIRDTILFPLLRNDIQS